MELESVEAQLRLDDHNRYRAEIGDDAFAALLAEGAKVQEEAAFATIFVLLETSSDPAK
jgi:hypothetical protein